MRAVTSRSDRRLFLDFPYRLYRDNPYWVPQLRVIEENLLLPRRNPFFEHGSIQPFLALDSAGEPLGRIAAIVNGMHLETHKDSNGFFGFFECVDDYAVAEALLEKAAEWLRGRGLNGMRGPASPSMNDLSGLLVDGFDREPAVFMPYNSPYYEDFLQRFGFERAMSMWAYYVHIKYVRKDRLLEGVEAIYKHHPGLRVRSARREHMYEEVRTLVDIHNDAFTKNWGHVPLSDAEFHHLAILFKRFVDPDLVLFLEKDGEAIGFTVLLPNINEIFRHIPNGRLLPFGWLKYFLRKRFGGVRSVRSVITGIREDHRGQGFDAVLCLEGAKRGLDRGYDACEISWVLDINKLVRNALESAACALDKEYAMFEKEIA